MDIEVLAKEALSLQQYLQQEVRDELGVMPDTLPQFRQAEHAVAEKMLKQKYGLMPVQLTEEDNLLISQERLAGALLA